jgi:hypothetical protein
MRQPYNDCPTLDCIPIVNVELNLQCRDEIIPILKALQHLYQHEDARREILELVGHDVNGKSSPRLGRTGLTYWEIVVLAAVRLGCNLNYDKLQDLAENHRKLRQIMGIGTWDQATAFDWRQIQDNITLLQPETIKKLNDLIVACGHELAPAAIHKVRVDAFVVETNIHYPTESSLLRDGFHKIIPIAFALATLLGLDGWRQHKHLQERIRSLTVAIAKAARSKRKNKAERIKVLYVPLLALAETLLHRARDLEQQAATSSRIEVIALQVQLKHYLDLTTKVLDIAQRRILRGEAVPNREKIFSIFEPHTELINRGKSPNPIQFGRNVLVIEDAVGFICDYQVVATGTHERDIVVDTMKGLQERHDGKIKEASFDRGFHSLEIQEKLAKIVKSPCLPPTGKKGKQRQKSVKFRRARRRHPGVESVIGALQSGNGLERCRDRTEPGYRRYVGLGVLGRNLHVLGKLLLTRESPTSNAAFTKRKSA